MLDLREEVVAPVMVFSIPILAVAGWIVINIVRTLSWQHLMETSIRERMALVAKGADPARLHGGEALPPLLALDDYGRVRAQGLLIGGFVTLVGGITFALVVGSLDTWDTGGWELGIVAAAAGLALLVCGLLVWPRRQAGAANLTR
ncbi:MAG TPA: hypothetical protein VMS88_06340 [Terriglobales bacterium]|nr:hypothetical protein [Terriglobales bacterium]